MIRVLLAEDHHLVRQGIHALLDREEMIEVVGEVDNGQDAVDFVIKNNVDVVVMDINMPKLNGIQATEQINSAKIETKVVILSMYSDQATVRQAIKAGAHGYLLKRSLSEELALAIKSIREGEIYFSPGVSRVLLDQFVESESSVSARNPLNALTQRERQVMQQIAEGHTSQSIANNMGVSLKTIEKHRSSLMSKLDIHDIAGLVRKAIKYGLIFLDE